MRSLFLGSPPFATPILARLIESPHRPELVVTPPARPRGRGRRVEASPVAELARAADLPLLQPESVKAPGFVDALREARADVFLVASYGELLNEEFLGLPAEVCLNVHPSLLPRHRGATPVQAAILAGDEVTGTTIQRVVLELDAGDVLLQRSCPVRSGETAGELAERLAELSAELAVEALASVADGTAVYTPQDPAAVTFCKRLRKEDGAIDWARSAPELERHVLGMNPWPGAFTTLPDGTPLRVHRALAEPDAPEGAAVPPGTVLDAAGLCVACGEGRLAIAELQQAGKRALDAATFRRGARLSAGERLGGRP